ncbi:MAG TPA: glutamate--tRNA ligase [Candidatus Saccharimonadia bacterium]|nr:glutamate--tRNA ligase [Candidatus Saccharimonadia bacterium]
MSRSVRVRFAPSPTGFLHVGSIRSGLFNWLWARHNNGKFILRIEDTDRTRLVDGAIDQICDSMAALGIAPDEGPREGGDIGPYLQSERMDIYAQHAKTLLDSGALYRCWCSPERLTRLREEAQAAGIAFKYDRHCLVRANQKSLSEPHVLRFRIPDPPPEIVGWDDAVRGRLEFKIDSLEDFVAVKTDNYPTYHFANVVDDHLMDISHVMRADEWLPSTPKHLLLFEAFGWPAPVYAHLPAVLGPGGNKKLSKRDGAKSVQEYISEGYLPEALRSFLASLGWNDGTTKEVYTANDLIESFTLERIQKSPAKFDIDRLTWMNGLLIRQMSLSDLMNRTADFWPPASGDSSPAYRESVLKLVQERLKYFGELAELTDFFFTDPVQDKTQLTKNYPPEAARTYLQALVNKLEGIGADEWAQPALEGPIRAQSELHGLKVGQYFGLIRVAVTGRTSAPGLFETLETLGRIPSLRRLEAAIKTLTG